MNPHPLCRTTLALTLSLLLAGTAQAAIYLEMPGVTGEATAQGHEKWVELNSVQWGVGVGISSSLGGKGARQVSRPSFSDIVWSQNLDSSVPPLFGKSLSGETVTKSTIDLMASSSSGGKSNSPYLKLETEQAVVTSVSLANSSVSASEAYGKITMAYDPQGLGINKGSKLEADYDLTKEASTKTAARAAVSYVGTHNANPGIYLRLGSGSTAIAGDSQAKGYENWIEIDSAQFGVGLAYNPVSGLKSKPSISELTLTQAFDATVPAVFSSLVSGQSIGQAVIEYVVSGGKGAPSTFMQLVLEDVMFSGLSLSTGGDLPYVSESLNFTKFSQTVWQIESYGARGKSTSTGYDMVDGKPITNLAVVDVTNFGQGNLGAMASQASTADLPQAAPIPEPQTWLMMLAGIVMLAGAARRRSVG